MDINYYKYLKYKNKYLKAKYGDFYGGSRRIIISNPIQPTYEDNEDDEDDINDVVDNVNKTIYNVDNNIYNVDTINPTPKAQDNIQKETFKNSNVKNIHQHMIPNLPNNATKAPKAVPYIPPTIIKQSTINTSEIKTDPLKGPPNSATYTTTNGKKTTYYKTAPFHITVNANNKN